MTAMEARLGVASCLVAALARGDEAATRAALSDTPAFMTLGASLRESGEVLDRLLRDPASAVYREVAWAEPAPDGDAVRVVGRLPPDSPRAGIVLTLRFADERVGVVQQQNLPARPGASAPVRLTPDLRKVVNGALLARRPMLLAYADEHGQPVLSFRGSVQAFGEDRLALWVRNPEGRMMNALRRNGRVALMYRDEDSKATYQFQGRARVAGDEDTRRRVYEASAPVEQAHDFARLGAAVVIELDRVEGYAGLGPGGQVGRVLMARDPA